MKIDRVLIALNNNKVYTRYWNIVAPVWKEEFGIEPTMIFIGTEEEFDSNGFDARFEMLRFDLPSDRWLIPWSLFWLATQFPEEVCMTCGVDQIPLSNGFFEEIEGIDREKYIVGFSDAYNGYKEGTLSYFNTNTNVMYPSAYNAALGRKYKEILAIEDDLMEEISKVRHSASKYSITEDLWGLDECYLSDMISQYSKREEIVMLDYYNRVFGPTRLYENSSIDVNLLRSGYYSEFTSKIHSPADLTKLLSIRYNR